jgi:hypothetical protein
MKSAKKARPPKTATPILARLQDDALEKLDKWRRQQPDLPSRPEALRRLADLGLAAESSASAREAEG